MSLRNIFRNKYLENYGLCPRHYSKAPALIWDAMCSMTKVKLDLILDFAMYLFFENSTRHALPYISEKIQQSKQ